MDMDSTEAEARRLRADGGSARGALSAAEHPLLSTGAVRRLARGGVTSVPELLAAEAHRLAALTLLSLPQVLEVRGALLARHAASLSPPAPRAPPARIATGINSLDSLLTGGLPVGFITEICGLAGSGKTQLCFTILVRAIVALNCKVLYVDTKGDFSAVQIKKYLENNGHSREEIALIMDKIKVARIWTMLELIDFLNQVRNRKYDFRDLKLIVIDSLPSLMFQFLGDENKISLTLLNKFVNTARYICNEHRISMICINILTRWVEQAPQDIEEKYVQIISGKGAWVEKKHRCLGRYWQHIPAVVIQLEKLLNDSKDEHFCIKATITKLYSGPCGVSCNLYLNNVGVT